MATTFHDSAIGVASASGTGPLATTDALAVTAGDLIYVEVGWEGATAGSDVSSVSDGQGNTYTPANALLSHANGDLRSRTYYATASSTGTINPSFALTAARTFRSITAFSATPSAGTTLVIDGAGNQAQGTSASPSAGSATPSTATGIAFAGIRQYGTRTGTAGSGWTMPAELQGPLSDASHGEYRIISSATAITGDATLDSANEYVAQLSIFKEQAGGSAPTVSAQPQGSAAAVGATTTYSVTSPDATSYQWQVSTDRGETWSSVTDGTNTTTAAMTTAAAIAAHNGRKYRCVLTNAGGNTNSLDAWFHVSGPSRNGLWSHASGLYNAQGWETRAERSGSNAPGSWYALRSISGLNTRDFATAARARVFPDAPVVPLAPWPGRRQAEAPRGYGTPLRVWRMRGAPPVLLLAGGSTAQTTTFSLDAALQLARAATASINTAIQAPQAATTAVNLAVQQALTTQASIDAVLQLARTAAASIDTAVQAGRSASTSADLAVQAARTATASADLAVQQARSATASIDTYVQAATQLATSIDMLVQAGASISVAVNIAVQAARSATSNVDVAVQLARTAAASVDTAVQLARSAITSVDTAVQAARSAGASIDLFVQAGFALGASIDTAVRFSASAAAAMDAAIALARSASFDVSTVVSVQRVISAAIDGAVQASATAAASLNLYVEDPNSVVHGRRGKPQADGVGRTQITGLSRPRNVSTLKRK